MPNILLHISIPTLTVQSSATTVHAQTHRLRRGSPNRWCHNYFLSEESYFNMHNIPGTSYFNMQSTGTPDWPVGTLGTNHSETPNCLTTPTTQVLLLAVARYRMELAGCLTHVAQCNMISREIWEPVSCQILAELHPMVTFCTRKEKYNRYRWYCFRN